MKKHIFGFALFVFIFASLTIALAYFYAPPIPHISEVGEKMQVASVSESVEKPFACTKQNNQITSEIINSQFYVGKNKLVSEIKLVWNGAGVPPRKVSVATMFNNLDNKFANSFGSVQIVENPFVLSNEKTFVLVSRGADDLKLTKQDNYYAVSGVSIYPHKAFGRQILSPKKEVVVNW